MSRARAPLIALAVILLSGAVHGYWTGRWANSRALEDRVARLVRVPMVIGDWQGRATTLDRRTLEAAEISGYIARRYESRRDGRAVTLFLVCGRPGPISVHSPEVCYQGTGFEVGGPAVRSSFERPGTSTPDEFWMVGLVKRASVLPVSLRLIYSWSVGDRWHASDRPRFDFAASPFLYKLYLIRDVAGDLDDDREETLFEFARELLPVLRTALDIPH